MESTETPSLKLVLEALVFSAQRPLTPADLRDLLRQAAQDASAPEAAAYGKVKLDEIEAALRELEQEHAAAGRSYRLSSVAGAWQFVSEAAFAPWLRALLGRKPRAARLTQPALETLTIIAYRQPVTRAEIEQIRGVSVDGVIQTLLERGLIEVVGRAEAVGRPQTYGTTPAFLEYFGIKDLDALPAADELRRLPVEKPETLLTVEPAQEGGPTGTEAAPESASAGDGAAADRAQPESPRAGSGEAPTESRATVADSPASPGSDERAERAGDADAAGGDQETGPDGSGDAEREQSTARGRADEPAGGD